MNAVKQVIAMTEEEKLNLEEAQRLEKELEQDSFDRAAKKQRLSQLRKQKGGVTVKLVTKTRKRGTNAGEEYTAVQLHGVAGVPMFFFPEHAIRLLGDSDESKQIRENILNFIEQNKEQLSWKQK